MRKSTVWMLGAEHPKEPVPYTGCGLDDIWLASGYDLEKIDGEISIKVRDLDGLREAIGRSLVKRNKLLSGKEIRFLRHEMELTQTKLAQLVGSDAQQIARYEKGQSKMPGPVDRLLRMLFREHLNDPTFVREFLETVDQMDGRMGDKQVFDETPEGWKFAA